MANQLLPLGTPVVGYRSARSTGRFERRVRRVEERAIEGAAMVHGAAYLTHVAITLTAGLSADEDRLVRAAPLAEFRLSVIVDTFAGIACREVGRLER